MKIRIAPIRHDMERAPSGALTRRPKSGAYFMSGKSKPKSDVGTCHKKAGEKANHCLRFIPLSAVFLELNVLLGCLENTFYPGASMKLGIENYVSVAFC